MHDLPSHSVRGHHAEGEASAVEVVVPALAVTVLMSGLELNASKGMEQRARRGAIELGLTNDTAPTRKLRSWKRQKTTVEGWRAEAASQRTIPPFIGFFLEAACVAVDTAMVSEATSDTFQLQFYPHEI